MVVSCCASDDGVYQCLFLHADWHGCVFMQFRAVDGLDDCLEPSASQGILACRMVNMNAVAGEVRTVFIEGMLPQSVDAGS